MLYLVLLAAVQPRISPTALQFNAPFWSDFLKGFLLVAGGQLLLSATTLIDQLMVVRLGSGSVSELGYANRMLSFVLTIGVTAVSRATLPVFAEATAQVGSDPLKQFRFWIVALFGTGWAIAVVGWLMSPWAVSLLYQRGAFDRADVDAVSGVVRLGLLQLPFYFSAIVCTQALASERRYSKLLQVSLLMTATKLAANFLLVPALGVGGVQVATALMYAVALAFLARAIGQSASASRAGKW